MTDHRAAIDYKEGQQLLFDSSYRAIPFNIIMASLLAIYLAYNNGPRQIIIIWLAVMFIASAIRMLHCKLVINRGLLNDSVSLHLRIFLLLTLFTSFVWTYIYFASIPYFNEQELYVIILVFGGMASGATTSLAVYFPSFLVYILSIFMPVIIYNYLLLGVNHAIFATMLVMFLLAITLIATSNKKLLRKVFFLTEQNKILMDKFEALSITDALSGLYNRRHFTKIIHEEYNRSKRNNQSFSLISIDIDNFKLINDTLGHPFGDKFIIYTADYLRNYWRRSNDIIFRLGGDEFSALLINTTEEKTRQVCEEIRAQFLKIPIFDYEPQDSYHQNVLDQVSMSIGVVYVPHGSTSNIDQIIEKADQSLYKSKHEGKNQINYTICM